MKDICGSLISIFMAIVIGHFENFSVNRSMGPIFWPPAIGDNLKKCGFACFLQGATVLQHPVE